MNEFEKNEFNENPVEADSTEPKAEEPKTQRNTNAPSGWTYSANTNQYVSWDGNGDANSSQWQPAQPQQQARREYGTRYGYYGGGAQSGFEQPVQPSQPSQPQNDSYQWDFNKYESVEQDPAPKKKSGKGFKIFLGIVAALLGICVISLTSIGVYQVITGAFEEGNFPEGYLSELPGAFGEKPEQEPEAPTNSVPDLSLEDIPDDNNTVSTDGKLSVVEVYKMASPSVVGIVQYQYSYSLEPAGSGSGIILSDDGYIVTNAHVIDGAEAVKVVLYNEEEYEAKIVGSDTQTDIAVLKIEANNLVEAEFGNSAQVQIGEVCYALGNPGGLSLQSSFTDGIVSGLDRIISTEDSIYSMTVLQTSAAINPGNSGGALINEYGQVIGITSSKIMATEYEGIGFAIPTAIAKPIIEEIIEKGYVSGRAKLGITGTTIDSVTAKYYNVPEGVQIITIEDGSSFIGTEAKVGDIITAYNGKAITGMEDLQTYLAESDPGDKVTLTLYRYSATRVNDRTFDVVVVLGENKG